ncbi:MAG: mechanosensitive ion channel family protein [Lachnospiraceae bacterium]|nr:mechanosensitive ion channel family protein [Lachnospiraceae bacterium]
MIWDKIKDYLLSPAPLLSVLVIVAAVILWRLFASFITKRLSRLDDRPAVKRSVKSILTVCRIIGAFILGVAVLQINGVKVSSLLAGLGITGIIVGYGLQDLLNDWVMGAAIIIDNYFVLGDYIQVEDVIGQVEKLSLKCTRIRDMYTGNIVTINNRLLSKVQIISDFTAVRVPIPYEMPVGEMNTLMALLQEEMKKISGVTGVRLLGIQELGESQITQLIRLDLAHKKDRPQVTRDALTTIHRVFDERHVAIPYNQLDVHISATGK